jgi:hypothetical protein
VVSFFLAFPWKPCIHYSHPAWLILHLIMLFMFGKDCKFSSSPLSTFSSPLSFYQPNIHLGTLWAISTKHFLRLYLSTLLLTWREYLHLLRCKVSPCSPYMNWRFEVTCHLHSVALYYTLVFCSADFRLWRWRQHVPPKPLFTYRLHGAISLKMAAIITTAVSTSNSRLLTGFERYN